MKAIRWPNLADARHKRAHSPPDWPENSWRFFPPPSLIMPMVKLKIGFGSGPPCVRQNDHLVFTSKSSSFSYTNCCRLKSAPCGKESSRLSLSHTKISVGILTRLTSPACLNQVSKNIYAGFSPPYLSSLLNPAAVGKATRDKSTSSRGPGEIFTLCSGSGIPRAGKGLLEQAASVSWPC